MDKLIAEVIKRRDITILCPTGHTCSIRDLIQNKIYEKTHLPSTSSVYSQIRERRDGEEGCVEDLHSFILNRKESMLNQKESNVLTKLEHVHIICPEAVVAELISKQISGNNILVRMVK